jgi:hypothetical protein
VLGKELLARRYLSAQATDHSDGAIVVQRPVIKADWSRVRNEWTLIKEGHARTFWFEHWIYSGRELKDRLLSCGFADVQLYGDLEGRGYNLDAARLIAVSRKL